MPSSLAVLAPRHVERGRHVAGALRLLLREVGRGEQAAGVLVGAAHVDQVLDADRGDGLVAEGADRVVLLLAVYDVASRRDGLVGQLAGVELPLLAAAVEQLDVLVAVELEVPVGVGGEPVVVAAVEHDGVVVGDAALGQQRLELLLVDEVAADLVLEVGGPVELDGALDVALVVGGGVLVDLDEDDAFGSSRLSSTHWAVTSEFSRLMVGVLSCVSVNSRGLSIRRWCGGTAGRPRSRGRSGRRR